FRAEKITFIFQHHLLLPDFNALENVMIPLLITGMNPVKAKAEAKDMLGRVGLKDRVSSFPSQLSGGESARVGVARALVTKKKLILADEPTGNLDRENSRSLMNLILELQKEFGFSIVLVTHDLELASLASRRHKIISGALQPLESVA
ncbi:MAG TPA: ATP-binding cassette domain-containing protein, partial [Leptospiraceae bacterium]|nr:ATP-binding cassette domain-containing protein [Leptospiraceae bacterium]